MFPSKSPLPADVLEHELRAMDAMADSAAVCMAEVSGQAVEWLWPGYLPRGMLVLLDGDPGLGKSFLTLDLAARLSSGKPFPCSSPPSQGGVRGGAVTLPAPPCKGGELPGNAPQHVLLLNAEDDLRRTVQPRLTALGADLTRCHALTEVDDGFGTRPLSLPEDLWVIETHIRRRQAVLVVIDPLMAFLTGKVDSYRDNHVRRVLYKLKQLAEETQATILLVRHLTKNNRTADPLYRGGGSIGIIGAARIAWLVGRHPHNESLRVLCRLKGNLGTTPSALAYGLESVGAGVTLRWHGPVSFGPKELLALENTPMGRPPEPLDDALALLRAMLHKGPALLRDIEAMALEQKITLNALRRAREQLGVEAIAPETLGGPWLWHLPKPGGRGGKATK
jgi:hypothetical protein